MNEGTQTLRTVADFRAIPDGQLQHCLRAFRNWLEEQRIAAEAAAEARAPDAFVWTPRERPAPQPAPSATTDIRQLGLRPSAVVQLTGMNIFALEDFAELSEQELSRVVNVGATTVVKVRSLLQAAGLDFRPPAAAIARPQPQRASERRLPARVIDDATHLADVGLRQQTVKKLLLRDITTVGALRDLAPRDFERMLSLRRRTEVYRVLQSHGLALRCGPSGLQLWRSGLVRVEDLAHPGDDAGVLELQPWLGSVALALERSGVESVGALRALAASGVVRRVERGLGPYAWTRIRKYFGMSRTDTLALEQLQ